MPIFPLSNNEFKSMFRLLFFFLLFTFYSCKTVNNEASNSLIDEPLTTIPDDSISNYFQSKELNQNKLNEYILDSITASYKEPEDPNTLSDLGVKDATLKKIVSPESIRLSQNLRSKWPHKNWTHARVYVMNFGDRDFPNNKLPYKELLPDSAYVQVIDLSKEEANVALELQHRIASGIIHSRCPITVRHAVVFFDANNMPVGGTGICFECEEQLFSPKYFSSNSDLSLARGPFVDMLGYPGYYDRWQYEEDSTLSKDSIWDATYLHFELIDKWQIFFDHVGAYKWHGIVDFKKEINTEETFLYEGKPFSGIAKSASQKGVFVNGIRNGYWKELYINEKGQIRTDFIGSYKHNKKQGKFTYYKNSNREQEYIEVYNDGVLIPYSKDNK